MNIPSQTIIDVLTFLLPGFVSAALLHSLTPTPHPIPFERVVQALIYTIIIQAGTSGVATGLIGIGARFGSIGVWSDQTRIVWSLVLAGLVGVLLAWIENTDQLHSRLRKLRITHQTAFSSEWYGALSQARGYLVLHLAGERRLYGWAVEWPNTQERGHFVMADAEWLVDGDRVPLEGVRADHCPGTGCRNGRVDAGEGRAPIHLTGETEWEIVKHRPRRPPRRERPPKTVARRSVQ